MASAELNDLYEAACADLRDLGPMVAGLIRVLLANNDIRPHSVSHRVKTPTSVQRKLNAKGSDREYLDEMHDLLGLRVITFFPDEVDRVAEVIKAQFEIDPVNSVDKRTVLDPDRFGYLSLHYVASLDGTRSGLAENAKFRGRKFEIQIRSILQHAWAEIEHDLGYHSPGAIPDTVRRRFSRLAGLLEVADAEFERLRDDVAEYQAVVEKEVVSSPRDVQINRDSIAAVIASDSIVATLDSELAQIAGVSMTTGHSLVPGVRSEELTWLGFESAGEVVENLEDRQEELRDFFRVWAVERGDIDSAYPGMSLFILGYMTVSDSGSEAHTVRYLKAVDIGDDDEDRELLAKSLLRVRAAALGDV
jgi:putative GTP pyrophosphokinase